MMTLPFNPHAEKTALYEAILRFRQCWHQQRTVDAVFALGDAIESAEAVSSELAQYPLAPQSELALVRVNLRLLVEIARHELARVQDEILEAIGQRIAPADRQPASSPSTVLPAGTILSCPHCEEGLYKVTTRASRDDLVLDDGVLLHPLNTTIPKRDAWRALACPRCGGRYYQDGKLHTVQGGWQ